MNAATKRRLYRARRIPREDIWFWPNGQFWVQSQSTAREVGYIGHLEWEGGKVVKAECSCPDWHKEGPDRDDTTPVIRGMRACKHWVAAAYAFPHVVFKEG